MVPTRIVLEGPELEPLLTQVRDEYGGRATIVSANKVRSGGLGGFFAKQRFELSVELAGEDAAAPTSPAGSLLDLADAREDQFEALGTADPVRTAPVVSAPPAAQARTAPRVAPVRGGDPRVTPLAIPVLPTAVELRTPAMAGSGAVPRASVVSTDR